MSDNDVIIALKARDDGMAAGMAQAESLVAKTVEAMTRALGESGGGGGGGGGLLGSLGSIGMIVSGMKAGFDMLRDAGNELVFWVNRGVRELQDFVSAAAEVQVIDVKLAATLKAVGDASGFTQKQIEGMASAMQDTIGIEDEMVKRAAGALLVFTEIRGKQFEETLELSADLAKKMGGDMESAARRLGRALESPGEGLRMLHQQGVIFTKVEMTRIKTLMDSNKVVEAQIIVLDKVRSKLGGVAEAVGNTLTGRIERMNNKFADMRETIGAMLLPTMEDLIKRVEPLFVLFDNLAPTIQRIVDMTIEWAKELGTSLQPVLKKIIDVIVSTAAVVIATAEEWETAFDLVAAVTHRTAIQVEGWWRVVSEKLPELTQWGLRAVKQALEDAEAWMAQNVPEMFKTVMVATTAIFTLTNSTWLDNMVIWADNMQLIFSRLWGEIGKMTRNFFKDLLIEAFTYSEQVQQALQGKGPSAFASGDKIRADVKARLGIELEEINKFKTSEMTPFKSMGIVSAAKSDFLFKPLPPLPEMKREISALETTLDEMIKKSSGKLGKSYMNKIEEFRKGFKDLFVERIKEEEDLEHKESDMAREDRRKQKPVEIVGLEDLNKKIAAAAAGEQPEDKIVRAIREVGERELTALEKLEERIAERRDMAFFADLGLMTPKNLKGEEAAAFLEGEKQAARDAAARREMERGNKIFEDGTNYLKTIAEGVMPAVYA